MVFNRKRNETEHLAVSLSGLRALFGSAAPPKGVRNEDSLSRCSFILQSQVSTSVTMTEVDAKMVIFEEKEINLKRSGKRKALVVGYMGRVL